MRPYAAGLMRDFGAKRVGLRKIARTACKLQLPRGFIRASAREEPQRSLERMGRAGHRRAVTCVCGRVQRLELSHGLDEKDADHFGDELAVSAEISNQRLF